MISRTYRGLAVEAKCLDQLSATDRSCFFHAVASFGFLVDWNESLTESEWRARIQRSYQESQRIQRILEAIEAAMGAPAPAQDVLDPSISPMHR